jgi:uncharacterized repeat protein (TIGR03806 family)
VWESGEISFVLNLRYLSLKSRPPLHFWRMVLILLLFVPASQAKLDVSSAAYGLNARPVLKPFLNGTMPEIAPGISGNWSAVVAFPNLTFTNSVGLTAIPGTDRLVVWEREGRVWSFENKAGVKTKKLIVDVSNQCQGWDDSGLLGLAFHPGFATNHYVFLYYTWVKPGTVTGSPTNRPDPMVPNTYHDRLSRFTLDKNGVAIPGSETVFVDLTDQTVWHHGGGIFFHPVNGFLYWTDGDNSVGDNDQIIDKSLYSGVFRIDVDCRGGKISHAPPRQPVNGVTAHYYIPNDNPFVGQSNVLEEFFCLGLRSPHRMTYDAATGRIFIGDVGESSREEIDVIEPRESGLNFQWNRCEGTLGTMTEPYIGISRGPVLDYPHSDGRAIIGGYVYRGKKFTTDLGGKYIFGDNVFRIIWALDETTTPKTKHVLCVMPKGDGPNSGTDYTGLSSFGTDAEGEIYFCQMSSIGGRIFTLARGGPPPPKQFIPKLLSQTGVFSDLATMKPVAGLIPYGVNSPLWSDGAVKTRFVALAKNSVVGFAPEGPWSFPAGTVFVKNFSLPVDDTKPNVRHRLETRLLVRDTSGAVYGASYKWRPDNSDADLVTAGFTEDIKVATATGSRVQKWFYPGRQDCLSCHTSISGGVLGVNARQLNGDFTYPTGVTDNQLRAWDHLGLFNAKVDEAEIAVIPKLVSITNTVADLNTRVRSYLDANCAQCHQPGGAGAFFDARFMTPLDRQNLINGPVQNPLGLVGAKVVVPGNSAASLLFHRVSIVGENQMPPIAKNVVDEKAVAAIASWINGLPVVTASLPAPWQEEDIGKLTTRGATSYLRGQFNIIAGGKDIWGNADSFHYVSKPFTGDGEIVARVVAMQYTDPWAKAGIMFREGTNAGAKYAFMGFSGQGGSVLQSRSLADNGPDSLDGPPAKIPYWLKLMRLGDTFTGFISPDGQTWNKVGTMTVPMKKNLFAGLALASHNKTVVNATLFDNVSVTAPSDTERAER